LGIAARFGYCAWFRIRGLVQMVPPEAPFSHFLLILATTAHSLSLVSHMLRSRSTYKDCIPELRRDMGAIVSILRKYVRFFLIIIFRPSDITARDTGYMRRTCAYIKVLSFHRVRSHEEVCASLLRRLFLSFLVPRGLFLVDPLYLLLTSFL
jgi:hypothetical protein